MIGLGLSVVQIAVRQLLGFDPKSLFAASEPGVWYDPSDFSTMFQDAAGTTPVTAVEQPVGLILDKSKGLVLGPELVTNGDFSNGSAGWTLNGFEISGGTLNVVAPGFAARAYAGFINGKSYAVTYTITSATVTTDGVSMRLGTVPGVSRNLPGTYTEILVSNGTSDIFVVTRGGGTWRGSIDNISVRELPGNHATQTTATSRPVLSARYNLLTKTEQFDDSSVWNRSGVGVTANAAAAPDGALTADLLIEDTSTGEHRLRQFGLAKTANAVMTYTVNAKAAGRFLIIEMENAGSGLASIFDLVNGLSSDFGPSAGWTRGATSITAIGGGYYRCTISGTTDTATSVNVRTTLSNSWTPASKNPSYTGDGVSGVYLWGADLRVANDALNQPAYQRVNTATDYDADPSKFKPYLRFDGVDDWLVTPTITPGTDKVQVFAGVRKLSDAANGVLVELSAAFADNFGVFVARTGSAETTVGYLFASRGSNNPGAFANVTTPVSPSTNVVAAFGDIAGDSQTLRLNGAQAASSTADQGTGNYLAYPLYIGRRGGTTLPFNGRLYGLIVRFGANLPAGTIASTETWLNQRTGAY